MLAFNLSFFIAIALVTATSTDQELPRRALANGAQSAQFSQFQQRGHGAIPSLQHHLGLRSESSRMNKRSLYRRGNATLLAKGPQFYTSLAYWSPETAGAIGACLTSSSDADLVFALPNTLWDDSKGVLSPLCGTSVLVTNLANNKNVTAIVGDVSASSSSVLSEAAFSAIADLTTGQINIRYYFPNTTFVPSLLVAPASSSVASAPASSSAEIVASSSSSSTATVESTSSVGASASPLSSSTSSKGPAITSAQNFAGQLAPQASALSASAAAASTSATAAASASAAAASASSAAVAKASQQAQAASQAAAAASTSSASAKAAQATKAPSTPAPAPSGGGSGGGSITGGVGTFFFQNGVAGNCGTVHPDSAMIIAIDSARYNNGANCGKQIRITRTSTGVSSVGTVADSCPTCNNSNSLDMSVALFNSLATPAEGLIDITWEFI